jgi:hypothetical protein
MAFVGAGTLELLSGRLGGGAYEIGAQALNFGAFIGFMGVNSASFIYLWREQKVRSPQKLAIPALGFLVCGFIWFHLSRSALVLGAAWMLVGIAYGAWRTRGFRNVPVSFEIPDEAS